MDFVIFMAAAGFVTFIVTLFVTIISRLLGTPNIPEK